MKRARQAVLLLVLLLTGCGYETLYEDLDERQANEMLALLLGEGLAARKDGGSGRWQLQTRRRDVPAAIGLLSAEGYPRERFDSLGDVFRKEGFVSSPLEERARLLHALSQELSRTMSAIDGVIAARVHLAIPERSVIGAATSPSSASIFIKHRPGADVAAQAASLKALAVNSIEGLRYDNVTVTFFAAAPRQRRAAAGDNGLRLAGIALVDVSRAGALAAFAASGALGFLLVVRRRRRARGSGVPARPRTGEHYDAQ